MPLKHTFEYNANYSLDTRQGFCAECRAPSTALIDGICWRHDAWRGLRDSPITLEKAHGAAGTGARVAASEQPGNRVP